MRPYFETSHPAGLLLLLVTLAWGAMEFGQFSAGLDARKGAVKVGELSGRWLSRSRRSCAGPLPLGGDARDGGPRGCAGDTCPRRERPGRGIGSG
jgi:hypothetical protein